MRSHAAVTRATRARTLRNLRSAHPGSPLWHSPRMAARTPHAATLGGSPEEVETRFFEALQKGDIDQLMACWADEDEITCIHPGGPRLLGAQAIRASFEALFAQREWRVRVEDARRVQTLGGAVHTFVLRLAIDLPDGPRAAHLAATQAYQKSPQGWRLVAHHASFAPLPAEPSEHAVAPAAEGAASHLLH